jgi:hypothetical protein
VSGERASGSRARHRPFESFADGLAIPPAARQALGLDPGAPTGLSLVAERYPEPPTLDAGLDYPGTPEQAASNVSVLWQADPADEKALERGLVTPAAWGEASLRWLVAPTVMAGSGGDVPTGVRVGIADVGRFRDTVEMFWRSAGVWTVAEARITLPDMSHTARVRWYRHGERLTASIMISFVGIFPVFLAVFGLGNPVRWLFLVPGAVLAVAFAALACQPLRAGIGVTPRHILVRSMFGDTTAVPWARVSGFEAGGDPKGAQHLFVLTSGGRRLSTGGYTPLSRSPAEQWRLLHALETERLARTPGAVSTLPPAPPPAAPGPSDDSLPSAFFAFLAVVGVIVLVAFGGYFLSVGIREIGPAIQATHGGGTAGYFIPGEEPSARGAWYGEFRLADGTVTRPQVQIADLVNPQLHTGVPIAARDTGDPDFVYPRGDQGAWHGPVNVIIAAAWALAWALALIFRAVARWLRRPR